MDKHSGFSMFNCLSGGGEGVLNKNKDIIMFNSCIVTCIQCESDEVVKNIFFLGGGTQKYFIYSKMC